MTDAPAPATESGPLHCPGCGAVLATSVSEVEVRNVCSACGALYCGLAVLRRLADDAAVRHLWAAAVTAEGEGKEGRCPVCSVPMKAAPVERGRFWTCKICEMVWVDHEALAALSPAAAKETDVAAPATAIVRCQNCGAAVEHTWDEQCRYCGAALHPPTKVIVFDDEGYPYGRPTQSGLGWQLARDVVESLEDHVREQRL